MHKTVCVIVMEFCIQIFHISHVFNASALQRVDNNIGPTAQWKNIECMFN